MRKIFCKNNNNDNNETHCGLHFRCSRRGRRSGECLCSRRGCLPGARLESLDDVAAAERRHRRRRRRRRHRCSVFFCSTSFSSAFDPALARCCCHHGGGGDVACRHGRGLGVAQGGRGGRRGSARRRLLCAVAPPQKLVRGRRHRRGLVLLDAELTLGDGGGPPKVRGELLVDGGEAGCLEVERAVFFGGKFLSGSSFFEVRTESSGRSPSLLSCLCLVFYLSRRFQNVILPQIWNAEHAGVPLLVALLVLLLLLLLLTLLLLLLLLLIRRRRRCRRRSRCPTIVLPLPLASSVRLVHYALQQPGGDPDAVLWRRSLPGRGRTGRGGSHRPGPREVRV